MNSGTSTSNSKGIAGEPRQALVIPKENQGIETSISNSKGILGKSETSTSDSGVLGAASRAKGRQALVNVMFWLGQIGNMRLALVILRILSRPRKNHLRA